MTKLPPGFTHELRTHLTEHNPPIDPLTGTPFIDLEHYCCGESTVQTKAISDPIIGIQAHTAFLLSSYVVQSLSCT